jgi:uncharacterized coiled-coil DUF342 family protein
VHGLSVLESKVVSGWSDHVTNLASSVDALKERRDRVRKAVQKVNSGRRASQMRVGERLSVIEAKRREAIARVRKVREEVERMKGE